jgi:hypothetical protein
MSREIAGVERIGVFEISNAGDMAGGGGLERGDDIKEKRRRS